MKSEIDRYKQDLVAHLSECATDKRVAQFQLILSNRTRYITVVLEDIFQSQNASAVLRTCDCTGIQDVHIIENRNAYKINRDVVLGSDKWLNLHYYNDQPDNTIAAITALKKAGYRVVATSPHKKGITPESFDLEKGKAAFLFGTELTGLSGTALEMADEYIQIPMVGFTESFNISVSAAILFYQLRNRLVDSDIDWKLEDGQQQEIMLQWLRTSIRQSELIEREFKRKYAQTF